MEPTPAGPSGGGRRHRGRGKRNNKRKGNAGGNAKASSTNPAKQHPPSAPPPPQTKVALRNIGQPDSFGTVKDIMQSLLKPMIEASNAKLSTAATPSQAQQPYTLELDLGAMNFLIQQEELAKQYLQDLKQKTEEAEEESPSEEAEAPETDKETTEETADKAPETPASTELEVIVARPKPNSVPTIRVRPLYVIPPKKTRRRGERAGVAYVLLTAPKIERIEMPPGSVPEHAEIPTEQVIPETTETSVVTTSVEENAPPAESNIPTEPADNADTPRSADAKEEVKEEAKGEEATPVAAAEESTTPTDTAADVPPLPAPGAAADRSVSASTPGPDYSRAIAQGRLLVQRAIDNLTEVVNEDMAKAQQHPQDQQFANCQVETAASGKTWRWQHASRPDRREGTIETTADYKNWLQSIAQQEENLKSRPKPTPGGGVLSPLGEATDPTATADGQPIAAIVQHLRAKQQERKRKKGKKKAKGAASTSTTSNPAGKEKGRGKGNKDAKGKKNTKKRPKKGKGGAAAGGVKQPSPAVVLKPAAPGGAR